MIRAAARDYSVWSWFALPMWCLAILIMFPPHQLDVVVSSLFFDGQGFFLRNDPLFAIWLYKSTKVVPILIAAAAIGLIVRAISKHRTCEPTDNDVLIKSLYTIAAMLLSVTVVWWLKATTGVYCPWSVSTFAGEAAIRSPSWSWVFQSGRCWPSGHSGTGFCLFALFFALRDQYPQIARKVLIAVLIFGAICSAGRIAQGAHFLSHAIATGLVDWLICATLYVLFFDRNYVLERIKTAPKKVAFNHFLFRASLFWTLCFNTPFLSAILKTAGRTPESALNTLFLAISLFATIFFLSMAIIALIALLPNRLFKFFFVILSALGLGSVIAWLYYGVAMTPDMIRNFLETDMHEAAGYWSWHLAATLALLSLPLIFFLFTLKKSHRPQSRLKRAGLCLVAFFCGLFTLYSCAKTRACVISSRP